METITAYVILLVQLVRNCIEVSIVRHCAVECVVEYANLRSARHQRVNGTDTLQVTCVVNRSEVAKFLDTILYALVNYNALLELVTTLYDTVSYSVDFLQVLDGADFRVEQALEHEVHTFLVVRHVVHDLLLLAVRQFYLDESVIRRFYKRYRGRDNYKAFTKYAKPENFKKNLQKGVAIFKKKADVIRVLVHPKMKDIRHVGKIKAPLVEVQVNGGKNVEEKITWAESHLEKEVRVSDVFANGEFVDVIGVTKGKGYEGVTSRFGCKKLPRKTHRGLRKVGCIGAWHPERVRWTVARAGQNGYHHRTEANKRILRVGKSALEVQDNATTEADVTQKNITPLGGFPHYGEVINDFLMLKGCTVGTKKRTLLLRQALFAPTLTGESAQVNIKFIDTSSKFGHGRFQTAQEKSKYFGKTKESKQKKVLKKDLYTSRIQTK